MKHWITSVLTGLTANTIVEKVTDNFWIDLAKKQGDINKQKVDLLLSQGKSIDQANALVSAEQPLWKKYGSRRINGASVAAAGVLLNFASGNETIKAGAKGMMIMGTLKALFPERSSAISFDKLFK